MNAALLTVRRLLLVLVTIPVLWAPSTLISRAAPVSEPVESDSVDPAAKLAAVRESIVRIRSYVVVPGNDTEMLIAEGSGIVFDDDGHIVTNNHVVLDGERFEVSPADGRVLTALLVALDPGLDIAVLQVDRGDLPSITFGDSDALRIGQEVVALGYTQQATDPAAGRRGAVVTIGSRFASGGTEYTGLIVSDVALYPGDSGGPLLDAETRVVGLNTAITTYRDGRADLSYSIPINQVRLALSDLLAPAPVLLAPPPVALNADAATSCILSPVA